MTIKEKTDVTKVTGNVTAAYKEILTEEALDFVTKLHQKFNARRVELLQKRIERQDAIKNGEMPRFLAETESVRTGDWQVASCPDDLQDRRVEITGPVDRKMMINALNSGAKVFMADIEDALSPTWDNVIQGQINLRDAVRRTIRLETDKKTYELNDTIATLLVRPRGWHLIEKNVLVNDEPISASIFDFGLYIFHNGAETLKQGTGPYFYLPKLESHLEARLWNDIFNEAQDMLKIPRGTIRATVLIETILAAFEMEEILYELRDHMAGLNAGRWDYIFSAIKKFRHFESFMLPDRAQVTMTVPFMRSYTELMVRTCHKRGAHAIGGMAAFIPNSREPETTKNAIAKVQEDKQRESNDGCDGTWVAHPGLVPPVLEIFDKKLGDNPNQKDVMREDVSIKAEDLLSLPKTGGTITEAGVRTNISVGLEYLEAWLNGNGAAAINNLMEDTATAEISRAQLWQWLHHGAKLDDGRTFDKALYEQIRDEEIAKLKAQNADGYKNAQAIMDELVLADTFIDFLTLIAYDYIQ